MRAIFFWELLYPYWSRLFQGLIIFIDVVIWSLVLTAFFQMAKVPIVLYYSVKREWAQTVLGSIIACDRLYIVNNS